MPAVSAIFDSRARCRCFACTRESSVLTNKKQNTSCRWCKDKSPFEAQNLSQLLQHWGHQLANFFSETLTWTVNIPTIKATHLLLHMLAFSSLLCPSAHLLSQQRQTCFLLSSCGKRSLVLLKTMKTVRKNNGFLQDSVMSVLLVTRRNLDVKTVIAQECLIALLLQGVLLIKN